VASLRLVAALAILAVSPLRAENSERGEWIAPEVTEFGDWSVACDNARECTAVSISRELVQRRENNDAGDYASPKMWVKRSAGPTANARVFVDTSVWGEVNPPGPLSLHIYNECDGDCTGDGYKIVQIEPGRYELSPQQVDQFFHESGRTSLAATRRSTGDMHGIISTKGLTAAMRYMDEVQLRRGTVTAIFAKGNRPASAVPAAPFRDKVRVVRGVNEPATEMPGHPAMQRIRGDHCEGSHDPDETNIQRFRLQNGQALWSIVCVATPHNPTHLWLVETSPSRFEMFRLPRPEQGRDAEMPILPHTTFDPASGQLTGYYTGKDVRSCGWKRRWAWTGTGFAMIDAIEMPACIDIPIHQWLQTYRAIPE
jgi:Protein of unknown function (DUF1176)